MPSPLNGVLPNAIYTSFFDDTLAALDGELKESMVDQIKQDLEDAVSKLAALKEKLAGKRIVAESEIN
ncbi:MAG: hypothetical protein WCS37_14850 [Chloroflexota bacterium]